jgi:hypothetical protein
MDVQVDVVVKWQHYVQCQKCKQRFGPEPRKAQVYWAFRMHLVGQLSNPPNQWVMEVLEAFPSGIPRQSAPETVPSPTRRLGNGVVQRAVCRALADRGPLSLAEIRLAVEGDIGLPVSRHSVSWCLEKHARGPGRTFERVALGVYRLAIQA